jgi:hypothetical protein
MERRYGRRFRGLSPASLADRTAGRLYLPEWQSAFRITIDFEYSVLVHDAGF